MLSKTAFSLRSAGRIVDLVIQGHERSGRQLFGIVAVIRIRRQMHARSELLRDFRKAVLGDGKQHGYRLKLGDRDDAGRVGGVDDVAGIHKAQAHDARNRGRNLGISQLQLGILDVGVILLDGAFVLRNQRGLRIQLLARNGILRQAIACNAQDLPSRCPAEPGRAPA